LVVQRYRRLERAQRARRARQARLPSVDRAPLTPAPRFATRQREGRDMGVRGVKRRRGPATAAPHLETLLWRVGIRYVAGVDEVGMGPLAGPVVAAAVVFPPGTRVDGVADSKVLTAAQRERLDVEIRRRAVGVGLGVVEP